MKQNKWSLVEVGVGSADEQNYQIVGGYYAWLVRASWLTTGPTIFCQCTK